MLLLIADRIFKVMQDLRPSLVSDFCYKMLGSFSHLLIHSGSLLQSPAHLQLLCRVPWWSLGIRAQLGESHWGGGQSTDPLVPGLGYAALCGLCVLLASWSQVHSSLCDRVFSDAWTQVFLPAPCVTVCSLRCLDSGTRFSVWPCVLPEHQCMSFLSYWL